MTFLAPWLLLGVLAAAVPLLIHLRRSRRSRRIVFSTTRFFDERFLRATRRARLQDRAVMLLRMALLALLALALAQPLLRWGGLSVLGAGSGRTVAIVIDDSASMRGQFESLRRAAAQTLDGLSVLRGDRATLLLAGRRDLGPTILAQPVTTDLEALRTALSSLSPTDLAADLDAAVLAAGRLVGAGGEVIVLSDLRAAGFAGRGMELDPSVALLMVDLAPSREAPNLSIDALQYDAPRPLTGVPFTFRALVHNHSDAPRRATMHLRLREASVAQRSLDLPPRSAQWARLTHRFAPGQEGWQSGAVELRDLEDDAQSADNARHFALSVQQGLSVLSVNGAPSESPAGDELFFFRTALRVGSGADHALTLRSVAPSQLNAAALREASVAVLANVAALSEEALAALEGFVDAGGGLFITLGDRVDAAAYARWVGVQRMHGGLLPARPLRRDDTATHVGAIDATHPALAGFDDASLGALSSVRLSARYELDVAGQVLVRTAGGDPLLVERPFGRGRVMLWACTLDRDWTDLPVQGLFVPLVHRVVGHLAWPTVERSNFLLTGQSIVLPAPAQSDVPLLVRSPEGEPLYPRFVDGSAVTEPTHTAGVYALPHGALLAVNVPSDEAATRRLTEADLRELLGDGLAWRYVAGADELAQLQRTGEASQRGRGLWDQLLILALVVGLFEPWLANRLSRTRTVA